MNPITEIGLVVETYVDGMARGDAEALAQAFHPKAHSIGHFDGALEWDTVPQFVGACQAEAIASDAPVPDWEIESVAVAGDTAVVRVVNGWAGIRFRDTLTLLRHDGRWQIVSKLFLALD